jgi:Rrf2 family nitric oxide-sensitive transcriptional repressor
MVSATIAEVAQSYGVSKNHLMKVAYQLGVAGYIETIRGRSGCLRLAKSPKAIILGEVVRRTEPDMATVTCFKPIMPFAQFNLATSYAALSSVRRPHLLMCLMVINDLVQPRARLQALLSIKAVTRVPARSGARRRQKAGARAQ